MHSVQLYAQCIRNCFVDLIPSQRFIRRDMNGFANSMEIAHETDEPFCKITVMRHRPQRGPITMDDDWLVFQHTLGHLPGSFASVDTKRNGALFIRMTRSNNRNREALFTVLLH